MHSFENASSYDSFFFPSTLNLKKEECFSTNVSKTETWMTSYLFYS